MVNFKMILNHLMDIVIDESIENDKSILFDNVTNFINTKTDNLYK